MFPDLQPEEVRLALENANGCIEAATATLLGDSGKCTKKFYISPQYFGLSALFKALIIDVYGTQCLSQCLFGTGIISDLVVMKNCLGVLASALGCTQFLLNYRMFTCTSFVAF